MRWITLLGLRWRSLFSPRAVHRELDDELAYHFEREYERFLAQGLTPDEAHYAAMRSIGALEQYKEECRDQRGISWLFDLVQDVAYAIRSLLKIPGFTAVAVFVLALAIGATSAVFTVVNAVLLRPLPFPQQDRLYLVSNVPQGGIFFDPGPIMVDRDFLEFQRYNHSFEGLTSLGNVGGTVKLAMTGKGDASWLEASIVGSEFCSVLGVQPLFGHPFLGRKAEDNEALLSYNFWQKRFQGSRQIIGKNIVLNGVSYSIAGVMPPTFQFRAADLWIRENLAIDAGNVYLIPVLGRLKQGVTVDKRGRN